MSEWTQEDTARIRERLKEGANWTKGERGCHASTYIQLDELRRLVDEIRGCGRGSTTWSVLSLRMRCQRTRTTTGTWS